MKDKYTKYKIYLISYAIVMSFFLITNAMGQDNYPLDNSMRKYVKAYYPSKAIAQYQIKSFEPAPPEVNYNKGYLVMFVTDEDMAELSKTGFTFEDYEDYDPHHGKSKGEFSYAIPGYPCYPTVEETFEFAQNLANDYPELATWIDTGNSWEKSDGKGGYDMMVLKVTNSAITGSKPVLFITSSIHAREYTTAPLAYHFANNLVKNYQTNPDIKWILDYHEVHFMFHANPDGRKKAEAGSSWRKNTNQNYCGSSSSSRGADLNRNFDFQWGQVPGGSSGNECAETYRGTDPTSEPEVLAIQNYMKSIFTDYNGNNPNDGAPEDAQGIYIDLHSYSELVLWPWGYTNSTAPNSDGLAALGRKFAYFNGYDPMQSVGLYPTDGTTGDYAYGELGIASYCIELGTSFFQNCSTFENTILPDNLKALLYAAKACRAPYMLASGPDTLNVSISGTTLTATLDDTRFNGGQSTQIIEAAEFYIDTPPWEDGAIPVTMNASDGSFNEKQEDVTASLGFMASEYETHTIFVRGKDANDNWGPVSAVFYEGVDPDPDVYCEASGYDQTYEYIKQVDVGSFSNTSGADGYGDFTSQVIDMKVGERKNITLTPEFSSSSYTENWKIWIDLNKDGEFQDSGEVVFEGSGKTPVSGWIAVPADTTEGQTRMRVSMQYNSYANPCGTFNYGEVEDYTVNITQASPGPDGYCESMSENQAYEYIAGVTVGDFTNTSGASPYTDFTTKIIEVEKESTTSITLTPAFSGSPYTEYFRIWADLNNDNDFEDSGEQLFEGSGKSEVTGSITIPSYAVTGNIRLRVSMQYDEYAEPCDILTFGEVEDYTLKITDSGPDPEYGILSGKSIGDAGESRDE